MTMYGRGTPAASGNAAANAARARSRRVKSLVAIVGAFVLVLGIGTAGWFLVRPDSASGRPLAQNATPTDDTTADAAQTTQPAASPTPTAMPTQTKKPTPKATPTKKPPKSELPPAPKPLPDKPSCTKHPGPDAPMTQVRTALATAAAKQYWPNTFPPSALDGPLPNITVPVKLMNAIAWQESGWQSTIIACDGGIGTMQVMPQTAVWANQRFQTNHNVHTLAGNTALGAINIEWLIMYFGLFYFGSFDLDATAPVGTGGVTMRLQDVVIAAYNVGFGEVEDTHGTEDGSDDTLSIPNQWYVDAVEAHITKNCPCPAS